jgi:hypothetical protein
VEPVVFELERQQTPVIVVTSKVCACAWVGEVFVGGWVCVCVCVCVATLTVFLLQTVLRVLSAYFLDKDPVEAPFIFIKPHCIIEITPKAYGNEEVDISVQMDE